MVVVVFVFFFKEKTAYEVRISDWSSDVCSSDLAGSGSGCWVAGKSGSIPGSDGSGGGGRPGPLGNWRSPGNRLGRRWSAGCAPSSSRSGCSSSAINTAEIGRASCRERVCQYVYDSVVSVSLKKKTISTIH